MDLGLIPKSFINVKEKCQVCFQAKQPRKPFKSTMEKKNTKLLELIYSDICEYNNILTCSDKRYFITFINDSSRYCHVYLLTLKSDIFDKFKMYKAEVENQIERKIKILRSVVNMLQQGWINFVKIME